MIQTVTFRRATVADADTASRIRIASITELCNADHDNDPAKMADWCANTTPDDFRVLIASDLGLWLGCINDVVVAVGAIATPALISLLYVDPAFQHQGISSALLTHLEGELAALGCREITLEATQTALAFYLARGWKLDDQSGSCGGCGSVSCLGMTKTIVA